MSRFRSGVVPFLALALAAILAALIAQGAPGAVGVPHVQTPVLALRRPPTKAE